MKSNTQKAKKKPKLTKKKLLTGQAVECNISYLLLNSTLVIVFRKGMKFEHTAMLWDYCIFYVTWLYNIEYSLDYSTVALIINGTRVVTLLPSCYYCKKKTKNITKRVELNRRHHVIYKTGCRFYSKQKKNAGRWCR